VSFRQFGQCKFRAAIFTGKPIKIVFYLAAGPDIKRFRIGVKDGAIYDFITSFLFHGSTTFGTDFLFEQEIKHLFGGKLISKRIHKSAFSLAFFDGRREGFSLFLRHAEQHDDCIIAPLLCSRSAAAGNPVYVFPRQSGFKASVQDTNLSGNHIWVRRVCDGQDASAKIQKTVPVSDDIPVPPFNPPHKAAHTYTIVFPVIQNDVHWFRRSLFVLFAFYWVCDISCGFTRYRFLLRRAGLLASQRQQRSHSPQTLGSDHPGRTNSSCDYEAAGILGHPHDLSNPP